MPLRSYASTSSNVMEPVPPGFGKRHMMMLLIFFGLFSIYALRVTLSVAILHMQACLF